MKPFQTGIGGDSGRTQRLQNPLIKDYNVNYNGIPNMIYGIFLNQGVNGTSSLVVLQVAFVQRVQPGKLVGVPSGTHEARGR